MMLLLKLFFAFIQVGLFSIGGGYAAIPFIREQVVDIYGLMTPEEFADLITVAYLTTGTSTNCGCMGCCRLHAWLCDTVFLHLHSACAFLL